MEVYIHEPDTILAKEAHMKRNIEVWALVPGQNDVKFMRRFHEPLPAEDYKEFLRGCGCTCVNIRNTALTGKEPRYGTKDK
jgi:hypothetical protein